MTAVENKALVRRFFAEIGAGISRAINELVAEDNVDHNRPPFPPTADECAQLIEWWVNSRIDWRAA